MEQLLERNGLKFHMREGPDHYPIDEIVGKQQYAKHGCAPAAGELWLDLGAHIGVFSVWAASMGARVSAFEPHPDNARLHRKNVRENKMQKYVILHEGAVIATPSKTRRGQLHIDKDKNSTLAHTMRPYKKRPQELLPVGTYSLKEAIEEAERDFNLHVTGCKMDIEGAEIEILERKDFPKFHKLIFEYHFMCDPSLIRWHTILALLRKKGYEVRVSKNLPESGNYSGWFDRTAFVWARR